MPQIILWLIFLFANYMFFWGGSLIEPFGLLLNLIGNDRFQDNVDSYIEGGAYGFSFGYFERTFFFISNL